MKRLSGLLILLYLLLAATQADEAGDAAYLAFLQARGEAPLIAAGADHGLAAAVTRPIPPAGSFPADSGKRELGFDLFHDARLSSNNTIACMSCHMGMTGGADRRPLPVGLNGKPGRVNTPTIFNSAFNFRQFWDGRAFGLDEQALGPLANPAEMGHDLEAVVSFVRNDPIYAAQFDALYADGVTATNIGNAIGQHSRDMIRSDSRFNAYLNGDNSALNSQEQRGWERFQAVGCTSCHNGINLGGNSYQRLGNTADYFINRAAGPGDEGVYARTGRDSDWHVFKVPTLHNVALTPPYFHDGRVNTLEEAVQTMAQLQHGRTLDTRDIDDISAFLRSTTSQFFEGRGMGMMGGSMGGRGMMGGGMHGEGMSSGGMHGGGMHGGGSHGGGSHGDGSHGDGMGGGGHHQMMHSDQSGHSRGNR